MSRKGLLPTPSPRRIVVVGPANPYRGGIAHFTDALARALRGRGHDISVVTFSRQYPSLLFPGKTQYENGAVPSIVAEPAIDSINPITWYATGRRIAEKNADAVIFQYWMPFFAPAFGTIAGRIRQGAADTHLLAVAHNILPHERRPGDAALGRYFLRECDGIAALSAAVAEDARSLGVSAEVKTLAHPLYDHFGPARPSHEARGELSLPIDAEILLFFGFVRAYKGLGVLLRALPAIIRERPAAHLVIAGEFYDDEAPYRSLIRSGAIEDHVHLYSDYIPESEVPAFFSACDVVVQPYVTATQSGVVQTAFHFERPVIVTNVGGLAEVVPHERAGLVVPPNDPAGLAAAVVRYFKEGMSVDLTEGVRREKEKYGWNSFCSALEEMIA